MFSFFVNLVKEIFILYYEAAIFILVGFTLAGLIRVFFQYSTIHKYLGKERYKAIFRSSLFGIFFPLCSCSVLPTAISLRKSGANKSGISIASISIVAIDPPQKVVGAFKDVSDAKLDRERIINEAQSYANEIISRARGNAQVLLQQAIAKKETRILEARGATERFLKLLEEYRQAPALTKQRIYLTAMEEILPGVIKYFIDIAPGEKTSLKIFEPGYDIKSVGSEK